MSAGGGGAGRLRIRCGLRMPYRSHSSSPLSFYHREPDGTLPIATCLVLLFLPCFHLYPTSSCWPWPAQGSHTIPLGSSGHRRYAVLSHVKRHRTVQRPIRRLTTPTSLLALSRWFERATGSESAGSFSFTVG